MNPPDISPSSPNFNKVSTYFPHVQPNIVISHCKAIYPKDVYMKKELLCLVTEQLSANLIPLLFGQFLQRFTPTGENRIRIFQIDCDA
jgi:hypothetical protein